MLIYSNVSNNNSLKAFKSELIEQPKYIIAKICSNLVSNPGTHPNQIFKTMPYLHNSDFNKLYIVCITNKSTIGIN